MTEQKRLSDETTDDAEEDPPMNLANENREIDGLVANCKVIQGDIELSMEVVESLLKHDEVEPTDEIDENYVKQELSDIERNLAKYTEAHVKIIQLLGSANLDTKDYDDRRKNLLLAIKKLKNEANKSCPAIFASPSPPVIQIPKHTSDQNLNSRFSSLLKRSRIEVPPFSGNPKEWDKFKSIFQKWYHEDKSLETSEKYHILRTALSGEAYTLIEELPLDGVYYDDAWKTLMNHYDNPLQRISRHLDAMDNQQPMGKDISLRTLLTQFRSHATALRVTFSQIESIDVMGQFFIHAFLKKINKSTKLMWEREVERREGFATFNEFLEFMTKNCNAYERANQGQSEPPPNKKPKFDTTKNWKTGKALAATAHRSSSAKPSKPFCFHCNSQEHRVHNCDSFAKLSPEERSQFVRKHRLCPRCFKSRCQRTCNITCSVCNRNHNTLIHLESRVAKKPNGEYKFIGNNISGNIQININNKEFGTEMSDVSDMNSYAETNISSSNLKTNESPFNALKCGWVGSIATDNIYALLATALVNVTNVKSKNFLTARALLDSGSQYCFITLRFAQYLSSQPEKSNYKIKAIYNTTVLIDQVIKVCFQSKYSDFSFSVKCLIVEEIVDIVPSEFLPIDDWQFPKSLSLADPNFNIPAEIDILFGLNVFWKILKPQFKDIGTGAPRLYATHLGWLVTGEIKLSECDRSVSNQAYALLASENLKLSEILERFWVLNEFEKQVLSDEENECERLFIKNCLRHDNGQFINNLLFKTPKEQLGKSKLQAANRFYSLERRFAKNPNLKKEYIANIHDYFSQGQVKEVDEKLDPPGLVSYYIPHHPVIKETSTSTKLRVVFDASMRTTSGLSLNDTQMVGPVVQSDLISIMLRSRTKKFIISADIVQMYRRILINPEDTPLQRILWRESPDDPLKTYELQTVTFGVASSPYLATRCLKKLAEETGDEFPLAKNALLNDFYVDDLMSGADSIEEAIKLRTQLSQILSSAGFELSKWCSNNDSILEGVPEGHLAKKFPMHFGPELLIKTLGLLWIPSEDVFRIWVHIDKLKKSTKRELLSVISSIFDPLGFLGPISISAKIIMQSLWVATQGNKKLDWDDTIPENIESWWNQFSSQLLHLKDLSIPRYLFDLKNEKQSLELHGFCDASTKAYGAVFYTRVISSTGECRTNILCSKARVAPLKNRTLPELELCGALTLAELLEKILKAFETVLTFNTIRLWSDSEIVLCWLNSPATRWTTFVANRVQKIQNLTQGCVWDHVRSQHNPADLLSRGIEPSALKTCKFWWEGPEWLKNSSIPSSPKSNFNISQTKNLPAIRNSRCPSVVTLINVIAEKYPSIFEEFSDFKKMVRIASWRMRLIWNLHWAGPHLTGSLQIFEINWALDALTKKVQRECFLEEFKALKANKQLPPKSRLLTLSPFLDAQDIIHVGGRIQNSDLSWEQRHQIVLPQKHPFSKLLIESEHKAHFHAGPQLMRSVLRRKFWILSQNRAVKHCIIKCSTCIRQRANTQSQFMAALPRSRCVVIQPFYETGVDYAGPVQLLVRGGRHKVTTQAYIAVFVCFSTKAIHLELVSNLTTEAFLAALNRFVGRRGVPHKIRSDNGTNFVGAKNKLEQLREFLATNNEKIFTHCRDSIGSNWECIPPHAPNFGGLWEAAVKSVKRHLQSVLKNSLFTYEQYETCLIQIEACLNSRPLTLESSDPNEPNALTPGHFLIGGPLTSIPNPDLTTIPTNRLKYWDLVQKQTQIFVKRFRQEYLNTLQQRQKWKILKNNVKVGDIVLVHEDNCPPTYWPLGRITAVHPGSDNVVRVVTVRIRSGSYEKLRDQDIKHIAKTVELRRPVNKLVYPPILDEA